MIMIFYEIRIKVSKITGIWICRKKQYDNLFKVSINVNNLKCKTYYEIERGVLC